MTIVMLNSEKRAAAAAATTAEEKAEAGAVTVIKKGPWTAAEDAVLTEYVRQSGEGNWNAVQRNTGLARCGKSCRLRWANHLRPNLKKGSFSQDEEKIIIELHAKLGNKWARMASQLPGRTDNEIKNFWNTRMKRRQRAGLPIYPHDQLQQLLLHQTLQYNSGQNLTSHNHNHNHNPLIKPITDPTNHFNFSHPIISNNSQVSQFVPLNNNHHNTISSASPYSFQYSSGNLSSMVISGAPYEPVPELPSSQTPASSSDDRASGGESYRFDDVVLGQFKRSWLGKSGLLGDLVVEGRAMSCNKRARRTNAGPPEGRGKGAAARREESEEAGGVVRGETESTENNWTENFSSGDQSSIGIEHGEDPIDVSSMDDDLMSLLTNFPSSATPVPEWYSGGGDSTVLSGSEIPGIATSGDDAGHDIVARNASTERKRDRSLGSCYWNNMPGIC